MIKILFDVILLNLFEEEEEKEKNLHTPKYIFLSTTAIC
jgi:hypothetical protein